MSYILQETSNFDVTEKVNILFKSAMGFPSTKENKPWFDEVAVKYNNYVNQNEIFLDEIPSDPCFNFPVLPSNVDLSDSNFATSSKTCWADSVLPEDLLKVYPSKFSSRIIF